MYCTIYGSLMQATMVDYLCGSLQMWGTPMQFHFASLNYPINKKFKHHEWNNWFYQQAQGLNPKIPGKKSTSSLDMRDFQKRNSIAGSDDASKEENSKDRFWDRFTYDLVVRPENGSSIHPPKQSFYHYLSFSYEQTHSSLCMIASFH